MATRKKKPKRRPSGPSGRSLTRDERRAAGQTPLELWLPDELVARVDAECERRGLRRTPLIRTALEEWLETAM